MHIFFTWRAFTPYGGIASIIAKFIEKIDFRSWVESYIPVEEKSNNGRGFFEKVLGQFLITLCGGAGSVIYGLIVSFNCIAVEHP